MSEELNSVLQFQNLRISLILDAIIHEIIFIVILIIFVHVVIKLGIIQAKLIIIGIEPGPTTDSIYISISIVVIFLICFNVEHISLWFLGLVDFLKAALNDLFVLIKYFNDVICGYSSYE